MECPLEDEHGVELILAFCAARLAPHQDAELQGHARSCPRCRELMDAQQIVWRALDQLPAGEVPLDFDARVYQRIAAEQDRAWWRLLLPRKWSWRPVLPVAAACAVLMAAFLLKSPDLFSVGRQAAPAPSLQIEQVEHALDDMDMLRQLGVDGPPEKPHPAERI